MQDNLDELDKLDEIAEAACKAFCECIIKSKIGAGSELSWGVDDFRTHKVFETRFGKKRLILEISDDALDQADEADGSQQLKSEIEKQLKVSESGGRGYVREIN